MNQTDNQAISSNPKGTPKSKNVDWALLWFVYLTLVALGLADNARGAIYPDLLPHFQINHTTGSLIFLLASLAAVVNNSLAMVWLNALGAIRALTLFTLLHGASLLALALSGWLTDFRGFLFSTIVLGAAMGGMGVTQNVLAAAAVTGPRRRQAVAGLHAMYGLSSLLAPLVVTAYSVSAPGLALGPVTVFGIFGVLSLSLLTLGFRALRRSAESPGTQRDRFHWPVASRERRDLMLTTISFAAVMSLYVVAELAISTRLTVYAREALGYDRSQANLWLSGFFVALFIGRSLFATVPVPLSHAAVLWTSLTSSAAVLALGLTVWPPALILSGFTMAPFYPVLMTLLTERMGAASGFATSWCLVIQGLSLAGMHWLLGFLSDRYGIANAIFLALGAAIAAFLVMLCLRRRLGLRW
jgi:fucose permease